MAKTALTSLLYGIREKLRNHPAVPSISVHVEKSASMHIPAIHLYQAVTRPWHSATFDGEEHELIFAVEESANSSCMKDIMINRLHDADINIPGHALIELVWMKTEQADKTDPSRSCHIWFKARTVSD